MPIASYKTAANRKRGIGSNDYPADHPAEAAREGTTAAPFDLTLGTGENGRSGDNAMRKMCAGSTSTHLPGGATPSVDHPSLALHRHRAGSAPPRTSGRCIANQGACLLPDAPGRGRLSLSLRAHRPWGVPAPWNPATATRHFFFMLTATPARYPPIPGIPHAVMMARTVADSAYGIGSSRKAFAARFA